MNDANKEEDGSVTVTVVVGPDYTVGTPASASVTVRDNENRAPTVANPIPELPVAAGVSLSYQFPASTFTDPNRDPLTYTATQDNGNDLPGWLTFTAGTRTFAGTPPALGMQEYTVMVKVTATDGRASVSDTFNIKVSANLTVTGLADASVAENAIYRSGTPTVTGVTGAVTWAKTGADAALFTLSSAGVLSLLQAKDFENPADHDMNNIYEVEVTATVGAATGSVTVRVTVTDVDEPPRAPATPSVTPASSTSLAVTWTAPDTTGRPAVSGYKLRYFQGDEPPDLSNPVDRFFLVTLDDHRGTTTETTITGLTADSQYWVQVRAVNAEGDGDWSSFRGASTRRTPSVSIAATSSAVVEGRDATFTLRATPAETLTVNLTVSQTGTYVASGDLGTKMVTVPDSGTVTYTVMTADDTTDETNGSVTVRVAPGTGYTVGWRPAASVTVNDNDDATPNTAPMFAVQALTRSIEENSAADEDVGAAIPEATDADGHALIYTMEGMDAASFKFNETTRQITTKDRVTYDHEAKSSYSVTIRADDGHGGSGTVAVTISIGDVMEPPAAPAAPTVRRASSTSLEVFWRAPATTDRPPVTGYALRYYEGASDPPNETDWTAHTHSGTVTQTTITGLTAASVYRVQVRALNDEGDGAWSASGAGGGPPPPPPPIIPGGGGGGGGGPSPSLLDFEWNVKRDIEALDPRHDSATGSWSDGLTLWLADNPDGAGDAVYAYDLRTGERLPERDIELDGRNGAPRGVWSDGAVIWVADSGRDRLFAYDLRTGERLPERDIELDRENRDARGIWSDGAVIWVLNGNPSLFAYDLATGERMARYALDGRNGAPHDIWSDGVTMWVSDHGAKQLFAYRLPEAPLEPATGSAAAILERIGDEDFIEPARVGNNSPRGIWSDGEVMYVADEHDDRVYTYNVPDAIDARLTSLALSGIEIGEFRPGRTAYEAAVTDGVVETTVTAEGAQPRAAVVISPPDADGNPENGHQIDLAVAVEITVAVTSSDGSRTRTYRVQLPRTGWDPAHDPWPHCLRGAVAAGFSLVVYEGGGVEQLAACGERRDIQAFYALADGRYVAFFPDAPDFVNRPFVELFAEGLPAMTPLVAASMRPSPDAFGEDLAAARRPSWPGCLHGEVAAGFSLLVYEGGDLDQLAACARELGVTALYALHDGDWASFILGSPEFVNRPFRELFADGVPPLTPLVARS